MQQDIPNVVIDIPYVARGIFNIVVDIPYRAIDVPYVVLDISRIAVATPYAALDTSNVAINVLYGLTDTRYIGLNILHVTLESPQITLNIPYVALVFPLVALDNLCVALDIPSLWTTVATVASCVEADLPFPVCLPEPDFLLPYYLGKSTQIDQAVLPVSALPMTGGWMDCPLLLIDQKHRSALQNQPFQNQDREEEKVPLVLLARTDFTSSNFSLNTKYMNISKEPASLTYKEYY